MDEKNSIFFHEGEKNVGDVSAMIACACDGLDYISETDSPVNPIELGPADSIDDETILERAKIKVGTKTKEIDVEVFFAKLTAIKDYQNDSQRVRAKKFLALQQVLEKSLRSLKVYRFGEIRIDIFVVGLDAAGRILGVRMRSIET